MISSRRTKSTSSGGRGFSEQFPADAGEGLIINETMARDAGRGTKTPSAGTWSTLRATDNTRYRVVGVVRDFHHKSLKETLNPTVLKLNPAGFAFASIRIRPENASATIDFLRAAFKKFNPRAEFNYFFIDDDFRQKYPNEEKARAIYGYFGILAVFVACLGLYGLASFIIERRTREIGIRKTLGAGLSQIIKSLSGEFLGCVLLANLLAWPPAWLLMNRWLGTFAYRIHLAWWYFSPGRRNLPRHRRLDDQPPVLALGPDQSKSSPPGGIRTRLFFRAIQPRPASIPAR